MSSGVELELPCPSCFHAVGRLVAGGFASRLELPVERIEDLQLAVEALLCRTAAAGSLTLHMSECDQGIDVTLGPFAPAPAERASIERMLYALIHGVVVQDSDEGEWIVLRATREHPTRGSS